MRISKGGLLVVLALLAPLLVELRTVLAWVNIELSVGQTALVGLVIVTAILVWAFLPEDENGGAEDDSPARDLTNGD
ncbi:CbaC protein [Halosolutus amylolyticus]|uniref:CbaC protein n=1 Tax=Halosolutus amylolyticus TaxID=2932267 RepID=A0ABD5PVN6_9EURY|nr:CbaC protein [Halosolutus amylolyticus]